MNKLLLATLCVAAPLSVVLAWFAAREAFSDHAIFRMWAVLIVIVGIIGYFTARLDQWYWFALINFALIALAFVFAATVKSDPSFPINYMQIVLVAYVPSHAAAMLVVGSANWYFRR